MSGELSLTCSRCGAPLPATPETIIAVCEYCGYPNPVSGVISPEDVLVVPSKDRSEILDAFWRDVREDMDLRRLRRYVDVFDVEAYYVPVWTGTVDVEGYVEYYRYEYRDDKRVKRSYRESFKRTMLMTLPARRQVMEFGVREALELFKNTRPPAKRLTEVTEEEWGRIKLEVLNTEMDRVEASKRIREDACDIIREEYEEKADGIDFYTCKASEPRDVSLYLVPVWTVYYKYADSVYRMVFSGWSAKRVAATEPITLLRRIGYLVGAIAGVAVAALGFVVGVDVGFGSMIIGSALSFLMGRMLVAGARVERG